MRRAGFFAASLSLDIREREASGDDKARRCDAPFFHTVYVEDSRSIKEIVRLLKVSRNTVRRGTRGDSEVGLRA